MSKNNKMFLTLIMMFSIMYIYGNDFINQELNKQAETIDKIEFQILDMTETIKALQSDNLKSDIYINELEKGYDKINQGLLLLKENNEMFADLTSSMNVSDIISAVDRIIDDVDKMTAQKKLMDKFVQVLIPITSVPLIVSGVYLYECTDEKLLGKSMMIYGTCVLVGGEFVWHSGKLIFKIW